MIALARKSNREKKKDRELKHKFKELDKVIDRQAHIITANNILLTCTNMLSTEYIRYIKEDDPELLNNTVRSDKRIKQMLNDEKKLYRIIDIDLKGRYKSIRAYLKGINKRIGHVNDLKDHKTIVNKTEIEFTIAENIIKETKKDNMYDFILGKELSTYYVHTMYAATIIENIIDKTTFKKELFSKSELKIIEEVSKKYKDYTKDEISYESHILKEYINTQMNSIIDIEDMLEDEESKSYVAFWENEHKQFNKMLQA